MLSSDITGNRTFVKHTCTSRTRFIRFCRCHCFIVFVTVLCHLWTTIHNIEQILQTHNRFFFDFQQQKRSLAIVSKRPAFCAQTSVWGVRQRVGKFGRRSFKRAVARLITLKTREVLLPNVSTMGVLDQFGEFVYHVFTIIVIPKEFFRIFLIFWNVDAFSFQIPTVMGWIRKFSDAVWSWRLVV